MSECSELALSFIKTQRLGARRTPEGSENLNKMDMKKAPGSILRAFLIGGR